MGLTLTQCGIVMSCFGLGSVKGALIGGWLTDKLGYYKVMVISLFLTSASFILLMQAKGFYTLCLCVYLTSLIADTFRPANLTAIEAHSKSENLTRSIGLIRLAINLGYAVGPFFGGIIAASLGYSFLFICNAVSVFLAGVIFVKFFKKRHKIITNNKNDEVLNAELPWKNIPYLTYLILWCFVVIVFFQLVYIVPLYYKTELGFDESIVGMLMGLNGLLIFIIEMPLIYKTEKKLSSVGFVVIGTLVIGIGVFSLAVFKNIWVASLCYITFISLGEMLSFPFSNTFALSFSNNHNRGKYMGLYTLTFSIAHVISPFLWFALSNKFGFQMIWCIGGMICLLCAGLFYFYKNRKAQKCE